MRLSFVVASAIVILYAGCGREEITEYSPDTKTKYNKTNIVDQWELAKTKTPMYHLISNEIKDFSDIVYPKHPRLYFRDSDSSYLKEKMKTKEWKMLKETITSRISTNLSFYDVKEKLRLYESTEYPQLLTFYAYMSGEKFYKQMAVKWAVEVLSQQEIINNSSQDDSIRRRIARLAEVYDWLYPDLDLEQKKIIRAALKKNIDVYMSWDYVKNPNYIQSHSRWGHGVVAKGLLAMYGDFDESFTKDYADSMLSLVREHFKKYQEVERYIAEDGGWHLGWMYGFFYGDFTFNYLVWSCATKETMLDDWMGEMTYWYLYALRADDTLPQMGDANINGMHFGEFSALYQKKYQKDGYAKWYLDKLKQTDYAYNNYFIKFLLSDESDVVASSPDTLPTSRYFKHSGTVVARDNWDENATMLIFKSSPFYSAGHHHRDENSFTIDYKMPLALDSGYYDHSDSPHYKNYYVRTIAHNAITVYNPDQKMYYFVHYNKDDDLSEKLLPNDGGQVYKEHDPVTLADLKTKDALAGVTRYHYENDYTYMQGDATKAYDPITVSLSKRDIVYLKDSGYAHPVTIVLDRVEATDVSFQKRYLLHMQSNKKPVIDANVTTVISDFNESEKVKMIDFALYPTDASLNVVGDKDLKTAQAYPYYTKVIDTAPLNNEIVQNVNEEGTKVGNWRLEVAPKIGNKYDLILNTIFVGDESMQTPDDVELIDSDNSLGVMLKDRVVVFSKDKNDNALTLEYKLPKSGEFKHTVITGYKKGDSVSIKVNGTVKQTQIVKDGGCVDFSLTTNANDSIKVGK